MKINPTVKSIQLDYRNTALEVANEVLNRLASRNQRVAQDIQADNSFLQDHEHYVGAKITGWSGEQKIVKSDNKKLIGVQSFSSNKLELGEHYVIDGIKALVAKEAKDTKKIQQAQFVDDAPAELLLAELVLKQEGKELIRYPFSSFFNHATSSNKSASNEDKYRPVGHTPVLLAEKSFELNLDFPEDVTMPNADDYFVMFSFQGNKLSRY